MADKYIPTAALQRWVDELWLAAGCSADEARLTADHLVGANLAGHDSHGVGMVPRYVTAGWPASCSSTSTWPSPATAARMLSLDAQRGMGQSMAYEAMNLAIERAQDARRVRHGPEARPPHRPHRPLGRAGGGRRHGVGALRQRDEQAGGGAVPRQRGTLRHQPLHRRHPGAGPRADAAGLCHQRHRHGQGARGLQQRQAGAGQGADGRDGQPHRRPGRAVPAGRPARRRAGALCAAQGLCAGHGGRGAGRGADRRRDHAPGQPEVPVRRSGTTCWPWSSTRRG